LIELVLGFDIALIAKMEQLDNMSAFDIMYGTAQRQMLLQAPVQL